MYQNAFLNVHVCVFIDKSPGIDVLCMTMSVALSQE